MVEARNALDILVAAAMEMNAIDIPPAAAMAREEMNAVDIPPAAPMVEERNAVDIPPPAIHEPQFSAIERFLLKVIIILTVFFYLL